MLTLEISRLLKLSVPIGTGWLLGDCMEAKGKQDLWLSQKPEVLEVLREQAIIQSVESSNRIEGVTVSAARLRPIVLGGAPPRDRSEEDLAGYRKALDFVFSRKSPSELTPDLIRKLHGLAQGGFSGDAGEWKRRDNEIFEILADGERRIRFIPLSAKETPKTMARLCGNYLDIVEENRIPPLLAIATLVFDFLCIHPFRDGNGRVSRLLTALLLDLHGFKVVRFISIERLIEESKEEYYRALHTSSQGWHEGHNEIAPWWNHFLAVVRHAYNDLEQQFTIAETHSAKSELVKHTVLNRVAPFSLSELSAQMPSVSPQLIKKVLAELKTKGILTLQGKGRGARWKLE